MASRLVPILAAASAAVALGCGANATATRAHAGEAARTNNSAKSPDSFVAAVRKRHASIWAVGDSAGGADATPVAELIRAARPDKVLYLGDIYDGDSGWRAYRHLYGSLPVARTPGNHDWPHHWSGPEWYAFSAAGWRILELNSETSKPAQQLAWLRAQLRARGTCRIAFWHRPRYSAGVHGNAADMDPYWRALQGHATLVLSGHDHDMERYAPRGGLVQIVAGAGGESHYPLLRSHAGLLFGDSTHWGALRMDLRPGAAILAFVSTSGRTLDSKSYKCA